jgi:hypothetical protein
VFEDIAVDHERLCRLSSVLEADEECGLAPDKDGIFPADVFRTWRTAVFALHPKANTVNAERATHHLAADKPPLGRPDGDFEVEARHFNGPDR